jgi:beta-lactamase regulating signal transducer with metallopeptidase domain
MNHWLALHSVAQVFSERLVSSLTAGTVLALSAWIALRLIGRQNSRTRFVVWFASLLGIALLPIAGAWSVSGAAGEAGGSAPVWSVPQDWAAYLFGLWAVIASIGLARIVAGLLKIRQLRRNCVPVASSSLDERVKSALGQCARTRPVMLCVSDEVRVPTAIGFGQPAVIVPAWCLRDLSPEELHAVVLHEVQHLRRRDDWTNLFQRVIAALFFFHPAVWWLERRLALEREIACDDAVIAETANPRAYARCLVSLAEKSYVRRGLAMAQAAVSRVKEMTTRITQILAADRPAHNATWRPAVSIVAIVLTAGGATVSVAPQLVAFQDTTPGAPQISEDSGAQPRVTLAGSSSATSARAVQAGFREPEAPRALRKSAAPKRRAWVAARTMASPKVGSAGVTQTAAAFESNRQAPAELVVVFVGTQREEASGVVWQVSVVRWILYHPPVSRAAELARPTKT